MNSVLPWMRLFGALAILWALLTYVGPADYADALVTEAMEKEARPQRVRAYYRELMCDCLKQHNGQWLSFQVVQQPDRKLCKAACFYDDGTLTKGTL